MKKSTSAKYLWSLDLEVQELMYNPAKGSSNRDIITRTHGRRTVCPALIWCSALNPSWLKQTVCWEEQLQSPTHPQLSATTLWWSKTVTYCNFLPKRLNMKQMATQVIFLKYLHLVNLYLSRWNVCKHFKHPLKKGKKSIMLSFLETFDVHVKLETDWVRGLCLWGWQFSTWDIKDSVFSFIKLS